MMPAACSLEIISYNNLVRLPAFQPQNAFRRLHIPYSWVNSSCRGCSDMRVASFIDLSNSWYRKEFSPVCLQPNLTDLTNTMVRGREGRKHINKIVIPFFTAFIL
jgi:hypothetical protein